MTADAAIVIVGGGLAGLSAARLLQRKGLPFLLLEARSRLGGRILSVGRDGSPSSDGFDLGPSWFWPEMQPALASLVKELSLPYFRQYEIGDVVVQPNQGGTPQRYRAGGFQQATSARIGGGTGALIAALAAGLPAERVCMEATVRRITLTGGNCSLDVTDQSGKAAAVNASHVILAMPPRLLARTIAFDPPLDEATMTACFRTPTWMAPHAKFFAVYDRPFWREMGLSGAGRSMIGPLVEIHDATTASGQPALFGFVGVSASQRSEIGERALVAAAVDQLSTMFGPQAGTPIATLYKDWASDTLTATSDDLDAPGHPDGFRSARLDGAWAERLFLAGSESSAREPGYLAGAVEAAERAVSEFTALHNVTGVRVPADEDRS